MRVRHSFYIFYYSNVLNRRFDYYSDWVNRQYLGVRLCTLTTSRESGTRS